MARRRISSSRSSPRSSAGNGWRATLHRSISPFLPPQRARTAIYADTYGDAGALDFFGPRYGLPAAISSQNNYYLWGTRGYDGATLVAIGATRIDLLRKLLSRTSRSCATSTEPYQWVVEGPAPIYICRDPDRTARRRSGRTCDGTAPRSLSAKLSRFQSRERRAPTPVRELVDQIQHTLGDLLGGAIRPCGILFANCAGRILVRPVTLRDPLDRLAHHDPVSV